LSLDPQSAQGLEKNTPQHGVLFGMTGAGKSVIVADLLAQIGHRFGFRLIVEEGLSHAVLTQTQGCDPITVNPNGNMTINYPDVAWFNSTARSRTPRYVEP
jgi:type IV secretory pathway VirB4 component